MINNQDNLNQQIGLNCKSIVHLVNHPKFPKEALIEINQRLIEIEKDLTNKLFFSETNR